MDNYYTEGKSLDITFCISNCKNTKCSRNTKGNVFGVVISKPNAYYSSAQLAETCESDKED